MVHQAEVHRQQLQGAVAQMEKALEDPLQVTGFPFFLYKYLFLFFCFAPLLQGGANVSIYKQYWDQYSGQLEQLQQQNPIMHHLLKVPPPPPPPPPYLF